MNNRRREKIQVDVALNAANIRTLASCCGHGQMDASIILEDGRRISIPKEQVKKWRAKE